MSLARILTVLSVAIVAVGASATSAVASTTPSTWAVGETMSTGQALLYFVGGPILLGAIIWVVAAAVVAKSRNFVPTIPSTEIEPVSNQH